MGSIRPVKKREDSPEERMIRRFCDDVYVELAGMRMRLMTITSDLESTYGDESQPITAYRRHLTELSDQIEWKLQILSHVCPFDWKGTAEGVESVVSVGQAEIPAGPEFSGGYVGG